MRILIVKLSAVGDVVMSLPFLEALRRWRPEAKIDWLVEEAASDVLEGHPLLDRVIVSRRKAWTDGLKKGRLRPALKDLAALWRDLRRDEYDLVVDLQGLFKSGIMTFVSRGRRKVGFDRTRELSWVFLSEKLPPYDPDRHALLRYLDVARYLGADTAGEPVYRLPPNGAAAREAEDMLKNTAHPRIAVNPGAKWDSKLWPADHWRTFCRRAAEKLGAAVVLTGSPNEAEANRPLAPGVPLAMDLTGRTGLRVLAEIFRRVDVVVCPDTGPMHLAAAVGTPVVALFGPTAPWRTGPYGPGHTVLSAGLECGPCFLKKCPDPRCMTGLSPETVLSAVAAILEKRDV